MQTACLLLRCAICCWAFSISRLRNVAHSLSDAVFSSFSGVISLLYAGAVADRFGVDTMLTICVMIAAAAVAVSCLRKAE